MKAQDYRLSFQNLWSTSPFFLLCTIGTYLVRNNSFFGDAIQLASQQAHWFYDNNFRYFFLPEWLDSGHPPLFGAALACIWKIFEKSLAVSHFMMLPFLYGIIHQTFRIVNYFFSRPYAFLAMLVLLSDPTLLAQSISVSPDIPLLFFFISSLYAIVASKRSWLWLYLVFLSLISMRGMMHVAILFVIDVAYRFASENKVEVKGVFRILTNYLPAAFAGGGWLLLHYLHNGWIGYHAGSPWAESFRIVDPSTAGKNILILFWRMMDFGRVFLWIASVPVLFLCYTQKLFNKKGGILFLIFTILILMISPNLVIHAGLLAHRYLLTAYFTFALFLLFHLQLLGRKKFMAGSLLLALGLLTGNLWRYPDGIAQGWDSTLAQLPYHGMRKKMITFIKQEKIPEEQVGSGFPNDVDVKYTDLSNESWSFAEKNILTDDYIFYSNVINDFSDRELDSLKTWPVVKSYHSLTVDVVLYKNPRKRH